MKVLVTGGAGFIGSNFVRFHLANSDDEITILDALTYAGSRDTMSDFVDDPRVMFVEGDICDRQVVASAMEGHHAVLHFAAESHVDRSIDGSERFIKTNCVGTNTLVTSPVRWKLNGSCMYPPTKPTVQLSGALSPNKTNLHQVAPTQLLKQPLT